MKTLTILAVSAVSGLVSRSVGAAPIERHVQDIADGASLDCNSGGVPDQRDPVGEIEMSRTQENRGV
ncbi:MAG: hypothetical protein V3T70_00140 [Phycisphaerae bacterium]